MRVPHLRRRLILLLLGLALLPASAAGALGAPVGRTAEPAPPAGPAPVRAPPFVIEAPPVPWPDRPAAEWRQPGDGAQDVSRFSVVRVRFDRAVRGVSAATVGLWDAERGTLIPADVSYDPLDFAVTLRPLSPLPAGRRVEVRLDGGIRELSGGRLARLRWSFSVTSDVTPPTPVGRWPAPRSEEVPWETRVAVQFSEKVRGVSAATLTLRDTRTGEAVAGAVSYEQYTASAVFVPAAPLWAGHLYRVLVGTGISDPVGNPLEPSSWTFRARPLGSARPAPVAEIPRKVPMTMWHVPMGDLETVAALGIDLVIRKFHSGAEAATYLDAAGRAGLRVIAGFDDVHAGGVVRTGLIGPLLAPIRDHPALYGYLALTEPNLSGIDLTEMRRVYAAYKKADPARPVLVSMGLIGEFGTAGNPWGSGVADIVLAEWYPIVYPSAVAPHGWRIDTPSVLTRFRDVVERATPGLPIWLVAQGHEYRPANRRSPTEAELADQVRDAFRYLGASGVTFYPWSGISAFENDFGRDVALQDALHQVIGAVRARTLFD